jgi:hypothetical protein
MVLRLCLGGKQTKILAAHGPPSELLAGDNLPLSRCAKVIYTGISSAPTRSLNCHRLHSLPTSALPTAQQYISATTAVPLGAFILSLVRRVFLAFRGHHLGCIGPSNVNILTYTAKQRRAHMPRQGGSCSPIISPSRMNIVLASCST